MPIGPVEYIVIGFPENRFTGAIVPALTDLVESGTIHIIDLVFVSKAADGTITSFEFDALEELADYAGLDGEAGGLLNDEDIELAGEALEPNSSAGAAGLGGHLGRPAGQRAAGRRRRAPGRRADPPRDRAGGVRRAVVRRLTRNH